MVSPEIVDLQKSPERIRHVCILAHVDHGKTTLADSILASNGIIPKKMAGKMRFLDSRKDEQERGITMKSSSVAIHHKYDGQNYLVNLIDSPGHADFYGEVCTAVRLCDGAIILVDVIEGVCPQTKVALQQAWIEHLRPLLVLNKIDRLILEWKLSPLDAYAHLVQVLEQVNAVVGGLFAMDVVKKADSAAENSSKLQTKVFDWSSGLDESDDSSVYFSPEQGNVIFASALDGWGFGISHFAKMYAEKLGCKEEVLKNTLWSDFYYNSKTKHIMKGAQAKMKKPLFVQFILDNIWAVHDAILVKQDKASVEKIVSSLNLKISARDARQFNTRNYLQALLTQWLPLSRAVLDMVCAFVPSPTNLSEEKIEGLMCSNTRKFESLPNETKNLKQCFIECNSDKDAPIIVCVSKMFPISKEVLMRRKLQRNHPLQTQVTSITAEEIALRREKARQMQASKLKEAKDSEPKPEEVDVAGTECDKTEVHNSDTAFVAFARVYSGTIRKGQKVYVLGPKHDPAQALKSNLSISDELMLKDLSPDQHITVATLEDVYLLMGENVELLDEIPAGNVAGITGLEGHILKSATLSSTIACPPFMDLQVSATPIMRVALEPCHSRDMPALVQGMKLLNQADPCVQVLIQESGEHVLVTAGEVHLQRCVNDLKERFAKIEINVSSPIVPFRETITSPPVLDMVNELIEDQPSQKSKENQDAGERCMSVKTPNKLSTISIRAAPLPEGIARLLEQSSSLLKEQDLAVRSGDDSSDLHESTIQAISDLKTKLNNLFIEAGSEWNGAVDQIWSFGPRRCGPNILLNRVPGYERPSAWLTSKGKELASSPLSNYDSSFISGFQLATLAGPLCDEPMMGVCFIVENWVIEQQLDVSEDTKQQLSVSESLSEATDMMQTTLETLSVCSSETSSATPYGPFTGQIMSTVKEACRRAFQAAPQRLMAAMYSCNIQVAADMLGKMYAVLGRRHGRVLHADLQEGSHTFFVSAELPVVESFDFANEILKQTSGMALPQLFFSHWEIVDVDPFWVPHTEEEYAHFGEKADVENRARKYVNAVRRRKGLPVDEKIVEHAEKQRTLARKK